MFLLLEECHLELVSLRDGGVVEANIVSENFGDSGLFEDGLPRTFGLTCAAIDALIRMNVELIGKLPAVVAGILVDTVNRTDTDASGIETISAKTGYGPGHFALLLPP
jgi:hypothetical protein